MASAFHPIDPSKYVTLPIDHEDLWGLYQATLDTFWTFQEINLVRDIIDFKTLTDDEQDFIVNVITLLFMVHDTVIGKEFFIKLMNDTEIKEATYFFGSQADTIKTHRQVYAMIMDELCIDKKYEAVKTITAKHRPLLSWALDSLNESNDYNERLLSFTIMQAIIFAGPAAAFQWISKRGLMPGLSRSNELIINDTLVHTEFMTTLFRYIEDKPSEARIHAIVKDAVRMGEMFMTELEPVSKVGLIDGHMKKYMEYIANRLLMKMGCDTLFNTDNPLEFMDPILDAKRKAVEFQNTASMANVDESDFTLNEDF